MLTVTVNLPNEVAEAVNNLRAMDQSLADYIVECVRQGTLQHEAEQAMHQHLAESSELPMEFWGDVIGTPMEKAS